MQLFKGALWKSCLWTCKHDVFKFYKIHEKASVSESHFERTGSCRLVKKTPTQVFTYSFAKILRTPILKNDLLPMTASRFHVICVDQSNFKYCAMEL